MPRLPVVVGFYAVLMMSAGLPGEEVPLASPWHMRHGTKADETLQAEVLKELRQYYADFSA